MVCVCSLIVGFIIILMLNYLYNWLRRKSKLDGLNSKHVVITGGSQGIGKSAGMIAAETGAHVTILARSKQNLLLAKEEITKQCLDPDKQIITDIQVDVTKFEELQNKIKEIDSIRPIDMLINCAGMAVCGKIENIPENDVINQVNLNLLGTYFATKAVLPLMKSRKSGIILLVGSQASLTGIYGFGIYSATKFALRGLAEALYQEVLTYNISVTLGLPPDTDTPGFERENQDKPIETKMISEAGGLFDPNVVAKKMIDDALIGRFYSCVGFESLLLTNLCCGMTPFQSYLEVILQSVLLGPMRLIAAMFSVYFEYIIRKCKREEDEMKKDK